MTDLATRPAIHPVVPARGLPQAAAVLAYAGALPFIVSSLLIWLRPSEFAAPATAFMLTTGALLIGFFGGVRWGIAVMRPQGPTFASLLGGVTPLLLALPLFFIESESIRFIMIIVALPLLLWDDLRATQRGSGAPDWYLGVRAPLTILLLASFLIALRPAIDGGLVTTRDQARMDCMRAFLSRRISAQCCAWMLKR